MGSRASAIIALCCAATAAAALHAQSSSSQALYNEAVGRETVLRREIDAYRPGQDSTQLLRRIRTLTGAFEDMAKLFPSSAHSDDALWHGARLSADAFWAIGESADRAMALRLFESLTSRFPSSALSRQAPAQVKRLSEAQAAKTESREGTAGAGGVPSETACVGGCPEAPAPLVNSAPQVDAERRSKPARPPDARPPAAARLATLTAIRRELLPDVLRFTLELEHEAAFHTERLDGPPRVFVDLQNTRAAEELKDTVLAYTDDVVKHVRIGRHVDARTRVVLDLRNAGRHSVYALYNPYRVVIDFERSSREQIAATWPTQLGPAPPFTPTPAPVEEPRIEPVRAGSIELAPVATRMDAPAPSPPSANRSGGFSLSRQLGLGIARVVIDPGHGGHDPGTRISGLTEADMVLDVALRLEKLLLTQPGVEVVLTRRANTYVSLEERTEIANRSNADLFLSIHVNANASQIARGVETYFLNFAPNAAAEAVAARENAGSVRTMRNLPEIVRAIALNNKIDESRDFAAMVQSMLYDRLRRVNRATKNLGVKQAPFVVLIGATMPSVLAEIAFMTNRQEAALLKTEKYRHQIADALLAGIQRYQQSLKKAPAIAAQ